MAISINFIHAESSVWVESWQFHRNSNEAVVEAVVEAVYGHKIERENDDRLVLRFEKMKSWKSLQFNSIYLWSFHFDYYSCSLCSMHFISILLWTYQSIFCPQNPFKHWIFLYCFPFTNNNSLLLKLVNENSNIISKREKLLIEANNRN